MRRVAIDVGDRPVEAVHDTDRHLEAVELGAPRLIRDGLGRDATGEGSGAFVGVQDDTALGELGEHAGQKRLGDVGVHEQKDGKCYIGVKPTLGHMSGEQLIAVADLAERYSFDELRAAYEQNLVLPHVKLDDVPTVWRALREAGLATANADLATDVIACPGLDYCSLANARSIPVAQAIALVERVKSARPAFTIGADLIAGFPTEEAAMHAASRDLIGVERPDVRALIREAPTVLDAADALSVIEVLRATPSRMLLVYDEYGHFQGIITAMGLLEAITGDFMDPEGEDPDIVRRADGSWLVAGSESADEFAGETGFPVPEGDFHTVAGMVLAIINRIPRTGDSFTHDGWTVEIADMDAMRIDRLIVTAPAAEG